MPAFSTFFSSGNIKRALLFNFTIFFLIILDLIQTIGDIVLYMIVPLLVFQTISTYLVWFVCYNYNKQKNDPSDDTI